MVSPSALIALTCKVIPPVEYHSIFIHGIWWSVPKISSFFCQVLGDGVKSCIIDAEAVAWDREKKQILPFQILSTRKRKVINLLFSISIVWYARSLLISGTYSSVIIKLY